MLMRIQIFKSSYNRSTFGNIMVFLFLAVFGLFFLFPIVYSAITAFKPM